jgi:hypothetical protein
MFAVMHSDVNSLKSGLLPSTGQPYCKKGRLAKVEDGIIYLILRSLAASYAGLRTLCIALKSALQWATHSSPLVRVRNREELLYPSGESPQGGRPGGIRAGRRSRVREFFKNSIVQVG